MRSTTTQLKIADDAVPSTSMDDQKTLIARIADASDRDAFKALFLHFGPRIKAMMMKAGADADQAEEIVQDVMMTVWRKSRLYAPERGAVSTWIYRIARNTRIDRLRRASSQPYEDVDSLELPSDQPDGEAEVFAQQRSEQVAEALATLPREQRRVIEFAYIHDMSQSEIAAKLTLPLGTVKSRMRLAYASLKGKLEALQ